MGNLKSATCKYCKMNYLYTADSYEVICPHCKKKITTPTGAKNNFDSISTAAAKLLWHLLFR